MFQVSPSAVSLLQEARTAQEVPDTFGLRVFAHADENGQASLALAFTDDPGDDDQVIEQDGTSIYLAPELAEPLGDSVLDVEDTSDGPQLALLPQGDEEE